MMSRLSYTIRAFNALHDTSVIRMTRRARSSAEAVVGAAGLGLGRGVDGEA